MKLVHFYTPKCVVTGNYITCSDNLNLATNYQYLYLHSELFAGIYQVKLHCFVSAQWSFTKHVNSATMAAEIKHTFFVLAVCCDQRNATNGQQCWSLLHLPMMISITPCSEVDSLRHMA